MPRRLAGGVGVPDRRLGGGVVGAAGAGGASSIGSPIEITDGAGSGAATDGAADGGGGGATELAVGGFGSSVETAITAATVRRTTTPPNRDRPTRSAMFFFGGGSTSGRLRIGARPLPMSCAVYTWKLTGPDGAVSAAGGDDHWRNARS